MAKTTKKRAYKKSAPSRTVKLPKVKKGLDGWPGEYTELFSLGLTDLEIANLTGKSRDSVWQKRQKVLGKSSKKARRKVNQPMALKPKLNTTVSEIQVQARPVEQPVTEALQELHEHTSKVESLLELFENETKRYEKASIKVIDSKGSYLIDTDKIDYLETEGLIFNAHPKENR